MGAINRDYRLCDGRLWRRRQGVDGIKFLAAAGGFIVLFLFLLIVASAVKVFIMDGANKPQESQARIKQAEDVYE